MKKLTPKKVIVILLILIVLIAGIILIVKNTSNNKKKDDLIKINISAYGKDGNILYEKEINTDKNILEDVIKENNDLEMSIESGPYGAYITSIKGEKQEENYYWNYYINDEYATVGISSYKIQKEDKISFKLEKFN